MRVVSAFHFGVALFVLSARVLAGSSPSAAIAAPDVDPMVGCPTGQQGLISERELKLKLMPYESDATKMDPPPANRRLPTSPAIPVDKYAKKDPKFPRMGSAEALLLVREDGTVAEVIVDCASSEKLVAPIVKGLSHMEPNVPTVGGKHVKNIVRVPIRFNLNSF
jgi:hypothetical protein